jgi:hypothetical protein
LLLIVLLGDVGTLVVPGCVQEVPSSDKNKPEQEVDPVNPVPTSSVPSVLHGGEFGSTTVVGRKRDRRTGSENNRGERGADVEPGRRDSRQGNRHQRNSRQRNYRLRNPRRRNYRLRNPLPHSDVGGAVEDGPHREGNDVSEEKVGRVDPPASTPNNDPCGLDHRPEPECVGCFRFPPGPSNGTQPTGSTVLHEKRPDNTKPEPRLRGKASPPNQLVDFCRTLFRHDYHRAYLSFLRAYPEYKLTQPVDSLRKRDYKRLKRSDEVYVDYMGASLYPESLVRSNSTFLRQAVLGNTHSFSTRYAPEVR